MKKRLMGMETEYAFSVLDGGGARLDQGEYVGRLMGAARERLPHLMGRSPSDLYLQTGARFYVDTNLHPEWSTPEVTNPWDAVRYLKAGNRSLAGLVARLQEEIGPGEVVMGRCNVSYGAGSTWGRHESYSHQGDLRTLPAHMIPFLASRVIYHGAGGFTASPGIEFTLSPRAFHILHDVSAHSTHSRAIFHTKQESLSAGGYNRVHILCGDSLCSDLGNWITVGATALVVAAHETGSSPAADLRLRDPVEALHRFARDPTCRTEKMPLWDGRSLSALDIQRQYCRWVGAHLQAPSMPEWAGEIHTRWGELLERLEHAPESVACALDAPMKLAVFKHHALRRSFDWSEIGNWTLVAGVLRDKMTRLGLESQPLTAKAVLDSQGPLGRQAKFMNWFLQRRGLSWDRFEGFLDLRAELQEIDTRWTQMGPKGIFDRLEARCPAALGHAVPGVDRIEEAMTSPPPDTRAAVRGAGVKDLAHRSPGLFACSWEYIWDRVHRRVLNMAADPLATTAQWQDMAGDGELDCLVDLGAEESTVRSYLARLIGRRGGGRPPPATVRAGEPGG